MKRIFKAEKYTHNMTHGGETRQTSEYKIISKKAFTFTQIH